jgi:hypothetical protein
VWSVGGSYDAHGDTIFPKRAFPVNITVFTCVFLFEQGLCAIDFCEAGHRWKTGLYASKQAIAEQPVADAFSMEVQCAQAI